LHGTKQCLRARGHSMQGHMRGSWNGGAGWLGGCAGVEGGRPAEEAGCVGVPATHPLNDGRKLARVMSHSVLCWHWTPPSSQIQLYSCPDVTHNDEKIADLQKIDLVSLSL
jgi:hypothetical protein